MSLGWNDALSTDAVPIQCTKRNTEESHEPTSVLPSQRGFKLASLYINKLITHIDQLRILLAHNEIDILSINETKLNETIRDNEAWGDADEVYCKYDFTQRFNLCGSLRCL